MWVLLVSCLRVGPDKRPASAALADESCLVTVQQARSAKEKSIVVSARGGCLNGDTALLCVQGDTTAALMSVDLAKLSVAESGKQSSVTDAAGLEPLLNWRTELPRGSGVSGVLPAPGAGVTRLKGGAVIAVVTSAAMAYMCDGTEGQLKSSLQICDTKILSSNASAPADDAMYCLSEKGGIFRLHFKI